MCVCFGREIENEAGQIADVGRFLQLADRYSDLQELDASTVNELIEKIVVHSRRRSVGRNMSRLKSTLPMWGKSGFHLPNRNY